MMVAVVCSLKIDIDNKTKFNYNNSYENENICL